MYFKINYLLKKCIHTFLKNKTVYQKNTENELTQELRHS